MREKNKFMEPFLRVEKYSFLHASKCCHSHTLKTFPSLIFRRVGCEGERMSERNVFRIISIWNASHTNKNGERKRCLRCESQDEEVPLLFHILDSFLQLVSSPLHHNIYIPHLPLTFHHLLRLLRIFVQ